jgi:hypothetical protein
MLSVVVLNVTAPSHHKKPLDDHLMAVHHRTRGRRVVMLFRRFLVVLEELVAVL